MKNNVVIIDSGLGGISLLQTFLKTLPIKNYIYFADTKNLPYGNKSKKELLKITVENVKFIIKKYKPFFIVFGCNTIGLNIYNDLCKIFSNIKIFAIQPVVNFREKTNSKLILGTSKTIKYLKINKITNNSVKLLEMPELASLTENNINNLGILLPYLKNKLKKYIKIDILVLGCTHYYFLKNEFKTIFPNVKIIDGVKKLANKINRYLNEIKNMPKINKFKIKLHMTKRTNNFKTYKKLINNCIESTEV